MAQEREPAFETILARLARRREDKEAWTLLYELMWPRVLATTFRVLHGVRDRAEDASQEVFIRLFRYCDFRKLRDPGDFQRYLQTVAQNVANDYLREMQQIVLDIGEEDVALDGVLPVATPEQVARARELVERLGNELTPEEKTLAGLLVEGHTVSEIAERLGLSYSNAGVRIHRLRQHVRNLLKEKGSG